jgi:hypothetical protein
VAAAVRPLTDAVAMARHTGNLLGETYAMGYFALTHIERGAMAEGRQVASAALSRAVEPGVAEHFVTGLPRLAQALALAATGHVEQAALAAARGPCNWPVAAPDGWSSASRWPLMRRGWSP